jgi:hypothetical protein
MLPELAQLEHELEQEFGEFEGPDPYHWPTGRTFDPGPPTLIPSGPYQTSSHLPCEMLKLDAAALRDSFTSLNRSIDFLEKTKNVKPRDEQTWDAVTGRVQKQIETIRLAMKAMTARLLDGSYTRDGCTRGNTGSIAQVTEMVRKLQPLGGWQRFQYKKDAKGEFVENFRRVRDVLVYWLRQAR